MFWNVTTGAVVGLLVGGTARAITGRSSGCDEARNVPVNE